MKGTSYAIELKSIFSKIYNEVTNWFIRNLKQSAQKGGKASPALTELEKIQSVAAKALGYRGSNGKPQTVAGGLEAFERSMPQQMLGGEDSQEPTFFDTLIKMGWASHPETEKEITKRNIEFENMM